MERTIKKPQDKACQYKSAKEKKLVSITIIKYLASITIIKLNDWQFLHEFTELLSGKVLDMKNLK